MGSRIQVRHLTVAEHHVERLAAVHISRYRGMIRQAEAGRTGIRMEECRQLLEIWESIASKAPMVLNGLGTKNKVGDMLLRLGTEY